MINIPLNHGQIATIDDQFSHLCKFKWFARWLVNAGSFYAARNLRRTDGGWTTAYLHRDVMTAYLGRPLSRGEMINHVINHETLDCRLSNLTPRPVSNSENQRWRGRNKNNTSGFKGVSPFGLKWRACIGAGGESRYLGLFDSAREAAMAYDEAAASLHGDFATLNFPDCSK